MSRTKPDTDHPVIRGSRNAAGTHVRGARAWTLRLLLLAIATLVAIELVCQAYVWRLQRQWAGIRKRPDHYYQASSNPALAYELRVNASVEKTGRTLHINAHGIRDVEDELYAGKVKLALLGDSVTFGTNHAQENTISELVQRQMDPDRVAVKVLNFGVAGYGLDEIETFLTVKNGIYDVNYVVFILNLNDFSRRGTVYEGADNGLYRMYQRPLLASPWVMNKLIYRMKKGGRLRDPDPASVEWYRWLYRGNRAHGFSRILNVQRYCQARGIGFTLLVYPAGCAYANGTYQLADIHDELHKFAEQHQIDIVDAARVFASAAQSLFDSTDHLEPEGNRLLAGLIADHVRTQGFVAGLLPVAPSQRSERPQTPTAGRRVAAGDLHRQAAQAGRTQVGSKQGNDVHVNRQ